MQDSGNINFILSNLFENIDSAYDIITFNSPYIKKDQGELLGNFNSNLAEQRWSGGKDGTSTIERFLVDAKNHLTKSGIILLGINTFHLSDQACTDLILACNYKINRKYYNKFTKGLVYEIIIKEIS